MNVYVNIKEKILLNYIIHRRRMGKRLINVDEVEEIY